MKRKSPSRLENLERRSSPSSDDSEANFLLIKQSFSLSTNVERSVVFIFDKNSGSFHHNDECSSSAGETPLVAKSAGFSEDWTYDQHYGGTRD